MWNSIVSVSDRYLFIYFDNYVNVTLFIMLRTCDRVLSVQVWLGSTLLFTSYNCLGDLENWANVMKTLPTRDIFIMLDSTHLLKSRS